MTETVCLSFDVEEFDLPTEYGQDVPPADRIEVTHHGLERLQSLLARTGIPATLFCTTHYAERDTAALGTLTAHHEIASHGLDHSEDFSICGARKSRERLQELLNVPVRGFRRPRLRETPAEDLREAGFRYDSSLNPVWLPGRYCNLHRPRRPFVEDGLARLPISCTPGLRIPLFWLTFKRAPESLYRHWCARTLAADGVLNLFFHPWEFADLANWTKVPGWVRTPDGERLLARLERLIRFLQKKGVRFQPMTEQAEAITDTSTHSTGTPH